MTRSCCTSCGLRFSGAPARLALCPFCAQPVRLLPARETMGLKRFGDDGADAIDPFLAAAALPPHPAGGPAAPR